MWVWVHWSKKDAIKNIFSEFGCSDDERKEGREIAVSRNEKYVVNKIRLFLKMRY